MSNKVSVNSNEIIQSNNPNEKIESNVILNNLNQNKPQNENDIKHCLICGQIIENDKEKKEQEKVNEDKEEKKVNKEKEENKENEKNKDQIEDSEIQKAFVFSHKLCKKCKGPFEHKKEKLEKLSIPILVSLLLQASLKHLDVNNMINQVLYGNPSTLKSSVISNINSPYFFSPVPSQFLIINDNNSIIINSKKKDNSKNSIGKMLKKKVYEYEHRNLFNFGALQKKTIQLTPSGRKPRTGPLGSYEDMIVQALSSIDDNKGVKPKDIFDWMELNCIGIPEGFRPSASQALKKACQKERVIRINGLYKINKEYDNNKNNKSRKRKKQIRRKDCMYSNENITSENIKVLNSNDSVLTNKENINIFNIKRNKSVETSKPNLSNDQINNSNVKQQPLQEMISPPSVINNNISFENSIDNYILNSINDSPNKIKANGISPSIDTKNENLLLYNSSGLNLENKKGDLNDITKYDLQSSLNDMNLDSITYSNDKNKDLYNQIIQEDPVSLSQTVVGNSTDELDLLPSNLLLIPNNSTASSNSTIVESLHQTGTEASEFENTSPLNQDLFSPSTNNLPLLSSYYMDPRLQYLISNNPLSSNVMDILRPNNINNTINPLSTFSDTTSTSTNSQSNNINDSFNYSLLDEMLWSK
ncbi:hypothetical protein BCR36DRAFT_397383 [Piromyces finnis]|uniref:Histone H1 n=1 Tax=Piromyces finnis TaxID=1754191 RepID=A0A1Y1VAU6_9FUNG|nr:hypothetical protein BCR36DRAFT_397383 [Piromyces finnis]|eukprot:ORX50688.1 hypothetical protein BCR36DRAFT_397383 [Piromyces finnis]